MNLHWDLKGVLLAYRHQQVGEYHEGNTAASISSKVFLASVKWARPRTGPRARCLSIMDPPAHRDIPAEEGTLGKSS